MVVRCVGSCAFDVLRAFYLEQVRELSGAPLCISLPRLEVWREIAEDPKGFEVDHGAVERTRGAPAIAIDHSLLRNL